MLRGLTTAAAGMLVNERVEQLLSNNLANQQTPGFKVSAPESIESPQQFVYRTGYGGGAGAAYVGRMGTGVTFQEGVPNFSAGTVQQTNRPLDVAIVDTTPSGSYAAVQGPNGNVSVQGIVGVGNAGQIGVNGHPLTVFDSNGQPVPGVYAVRNPQYQGKALTSSAGAPDYDANGNPSYLFERANGQIVDVPGHDTTQRYSIRVGTQDDMGLHSFFAVDYVSPQGPSGIALTKDGSLQLDANNNLVDAAGHYILPVNAAGQPLPGARIVVNPNYSGSALFSANGQALSDASGRPSYRVYDANGNFVPGAHLGTVDADVTQLSPLGQTEFMVGNSLNATTVLPQLQTSSGKLKPGELEGSNVDVASVMAQMLNATNLYEANQRVVQTEDTLLGKAANDIGHVNG